MFRSFILAGFFIFTSITVARTGDVVFGDLEFGQPTIRATVPSAQVAAGYVSITNNGKVADRLIGGAATFAARLEIHEMKMDNEVMKMSHLHAGVEIPAGETVRLLPGGYHLMLMKPGEQLKAGESRAIKLTFERAGSLEIDFQVKSIAETMKMKKKHSH